MKRVLFCLMFLIMFSFVAAQGFEEYYKIDLNWNRGEFKLVNLDIEFSSTLIENPFGFYLVKVVGSENQTLNLTFFNVPNKILYDAVDENGTIVGGGLTILNETNFTIYVPYSENSNEILIYDEELNEKLRIDVSMYSKKEVGEKETLTEKERLAKEELEREKLKTEKEAEIFSEKLVRNWWVFGIILLILLVILIKSFVKKK